MMDEGTGAVAYPVTGRAPPRALRVRSAMGGDHDIGRSHILLVERCFAGAERAQPIPHQWVMHQLPENGDWSAGGQFFRAGNGVADSKTHSIMFGADNFHR